MAYKVVHRIKNGAVVSAYDIENVDGSILRIDKVYMSFLVGKGMIDGVTAAIYKDSIIFKGKLSEVPVINEKKVDDSERFSVNRLVKKGRMTIGCYYNEKEEMVDRETFERDALSGMLSNVRAQHYKGKVLFRGCSELPVERV